MSFFDSLIMLPDDPILGLTHSYAADERQKKVNLGVGAYKSSEGTPMVLSSVKKAEKILLEKNLNKEYLPIDGLPDFTQEATKLIFGKESPQYYCAQTIGGTGALRIGGEFLCQDVSKNIYFSDPTWPNHKAIFTRVGMKLDQYAYYDEKQHRLDFSKMCASIKQIPARSIIMLHACCHNPTGIDPTFEQWKELSDIIKRQNLFPFFDLAYLGFGEGIHEDAKAVRYFADQDHELLVSFSCSKNFGLYGERVGALALVAASQDAANKAGSQIRSLIRANYSNPPSHGVRIVSTILKSKELRQEWEQELSAMRDRIKEMRKALVGELIAKQNGRDFSFMNQQNGIFSFSGLDQDQVLQLRKENAIYMPGNGRINVAGLNWHNLNYVVDSIISVL